VSETRFWGVSVLLRRREGVKVFSLKKCSPNRALFKCMPIYKVCSSPGGTGTDIRFMPEAFSDFTVNTIFHQNAIERRGHSHPATLLVGCFTTRVRSERPVANPLLPGVTRLLSKHHKSDHAAPPPAPRPLRTRWQRFPIPHRCLLASTACEPHTRSSQQSTV
jgi:hypothetical protein